MKSLSRVVIWIAGSIIGLVVILFGGFLLFSVIHEYRPDPIESVEVDGSSSEKSDTTRVFSLIIWNIGYGGLGKEMDFFYDGGKNVRPEEPYFEQSIAGIGSFITQHDSVDFFLLQEVDMDSKRSYSLNEVNWLGTILPDFCISFAANYNCRYVPMPVTDPMGPVISGLVSCSRFQPEEVIRHGFDKHVSWPNRLFYLKRCFMVSRYALDDGHQLLLINIHNSAFDTGGVLRKREMEMIRQFMLDEYEKGNFLVAGGDWNANPHLFNPDDMISGDRVKKDEFTDMNTFFPDWEFVFDPRYPTNRDVDNPYQHGVTPVTILDFYLVSPNIRVRGIQTLQTGFEHSDHQPVYLQIALHL
jgi:endonuclease/exonuclease/phosphatase family metal-dependent hydrolase